MGWVFVVICAVAAYRFYGGQNHDIFKITLAVAIVNFWSFGVMSNFSHSPQKASNFWTSINILSTVIGAGLFLYSFIV